MSIHVRRGGSTRSWLAIAGLLAFVAITLATGSFGLK